MSSNALILPNVELMKASNVPALLEKIRPHWQTKSLIDRVRRLLDIDPSSACQRLLNAAIHDLREKVVIAGIDIASEAAKQNKLPPISSAEDIEGYSTSKLIDLAYFMGLFSRPDWRRISRCYEIRRDLEHEDDEYEAGIEDCVYIFNTCIEVILAKDPIQLLKVKDIKDVIEQPTSAILAEALLLDYEGAPQPRQEEILKFLISISLDRNQSDVVQQNAFLSIGQLRARTHAQVILKLGTYLQDKIGRQDIDIRTARVAQAAGVFPYLRQSARKDFFEKFYQEMHQAGWHWSAYQVHGELLGSFKEFGAFGSCPEEITNKILKWMILAYIGVPGGRTQYGNVRQVFYSNTAAPLIRDVLEEAPSSIGEAVKRLRDDGDVKEALTDQHVARRFENIIDLIEKT